MAKGPDLEETIQKMVEGDTDSGGPGIRADHHQEMVKTYLQLRRQVDEVSPHTRRNDVSALLKLCDYLHREHDDKPFEEVTREDMRDWVDSLRDHYNLADSTRDQYQMHVKRFYKWVAEPDEYERGRHRQSEIGYPRAVEWMNPNSNRGKKTIPADSLLDEQDVKRMVEVCDSHRDKALIMTLWDTGLRVKELINLDVRNFQTDRDGGILLLNSDGDEQKTGQRRIRLVEATLFLRDHLNTHPFSDAAQAPLFHTCNSKDYARAVRVLKDENSVTEESGAPDRAEVLEGLRLTRSGVQGIVNRVADHAGISKNVTPHSFRHGRATYLAAKGLTESVLRQRFGWSPTSDTPARYQHMAGAHSDEALFRALDKEPRQEPEEPLLTEEECPYGHDNEPTAKFCTTCGAPVDPEDAARNPGAMGQRLLEAVDDDKTAEEVTRALIRRFLEEDEAEDSLG